MRLRLQNIRKAFAAAMCVCISLFAFQAPVGASAPASEAGLNSLPGGGAYVMHRDGLATTAAMELWFRAPSAGSDAKYPGISRLAITALAASRPAHGTSLTELVERLGGTLTISVYPDIVMVGASVPSWDAPQVLRTLTTTYFNPQISAEGLKTAVRDCAIAGAETRFDAERTLQDALFAQLFSAGPARYPPTPAAAADFTKIPSNAVKAFAAHAFRQNNVVLSLAGAVDAPLLANVRSGTATGPPMDPAYDSTRAASPGTSTKSSYVAGFGYAWAGPPIADTKAATALDFIADYAFDNEHGTLARDIQKTNADAFVNGQFITLHDPGVLLLTVSGANSPAVRQQVDRALQALTQPMDRSAFEAARNAFEYHIFNQTQTPLSRADNFGWYAAEGNAAYAPGAVSGEYVKAVQSLDPGFIAQIARTYLQHPAVVQLLSVQQKGTST